MDIIRYKYPEKPNISRTAVALGYFDGVHIAHRELISLLVREARAKGLSSYVLTFENSILKAKKTQTVIYNTEEKLEIFASLGVDGVIIADFDSISSLSPESFVRDVLIDAFDTQLAVSGYNFRFGKGASADAMRLVEFMRGECREAIILGEKTIDGEPVSATLIREALSERRLDAATRMLGVPYSVSGTVERGLGLGKGFGFPTVNIPLRADSPLGVGVYRTAVKIGEKLYTGITNVGSCPTVKEREIHTETLIADYDGNLYGTRVTVYFLGYLREEKHFDTIPELREQIYADRDKAIKENGDLKWLEIGLN